MWELDSIKKGSIKIMGIQGGEERKNRTGSLLKEKKMRTSQIWERS